MTFRPQLLSVLVASALAAMSASSAHAAIDLIAIGSLNQATDLSGLTNTLENGLAGNVLGGIGSGLAWAGGNTFLALPDRGPNATPYVNTVDDTVSYIARWQTVSLNLAKSATALPNGLGYTLTPALNSTTLLYSTTPLNYGPVTASANTATKFYFDGRSDNYAAGNSLNSANARLDPEALRVSNDGRSVFLADEYGPYVYQFERTTGKRIKTFTLPANLAVANLSPNSATEISGNTVGRIANKGMEGLAITPDGQTLYGFMQSPLEQDSVGGAGKGQYNRIVKIDIASGAVKEFAYDNKVGTKTFNSSEMLALNDHQFLVLERDGSGLGNGDAAAFKQLRLVDLAGAVDVTSLSGAAALQPYAKSTTLFLDIFASLTSHGVSAANVPAKLEGAAFGADIVDGGVTYHTLYIGNDNDFVPGVAGTNQFFVFRFSDADLASKGVTAFANQTISAVPEPESYALMLAGLVGLGMLSRRRARAAA